jgi:PAS domain S-box-containing protein
MAPGGSAGVLAGQLQLDLFVRAVNDSAIFMLDPLDPAGRVASWNPGAEHIKGYRADEIIGRHFSVFYPTEDVEAGLPERLLNEAIQHGHVEHEGWRVRSDGSRFWGDVEITAI